MKAEQIEADIKYLDQIRDIEIQSNMLNEFLSDEGNIRMTSASASKDSKSFMLMPLNSYSNEVLSIMHRHILNLFTEVHAQLNKEKANLLKEFNDL